MMQPNDEFDWIKDIWSPRCSPKMKLFMWSIVQDALPLGENLQRRGVTSDVLCPRCKSVESKMHTFFLCPFAKEVWSKIPLREAVHLAATDTFKSAMVRFRSATCLPPSGVSNTIIPWVCWSIWKDRNSLIFEGVGKQPVEIATTGIALAKEWNEAQLPSEKVQTTYLRNQMDRLREIPKANRQISVWLTDAAWDANRLRAGLAWVQIGESGTTIRKGASIQNFVNSPLIAEALALREGLFLAADQGIENLWIGSDNLTLIGAITDKTQRKELLGIIKDIHNLSAAFVSTRFFHIPREKVEEADALAKAFLRNSVV